VVPGDLSLLRTLEALAVGVQGKRCLWRALQDLRSLPSTVGGMTFVALEAKAVRQWEAIEDALLTSRTFSAVYLRQTMVAGIEAGPCTACRDPDIERDYHGHDKD